MVTNTDRLPDSPPQNGSSKVVHFCFFLPCIPINVFYLYLQNLFNQFYWRTIKQRSLLKLTVARTLQRHNIENLKQIFQEKELRRLSTIFHIHVPVSDLYIPYSAYSAAWEYINRSQTQECGNWDWGRAIHFLGIHKWDFRCSADEQPPPENRRYRPIFVNFYNRTTPVPPSPPFKLGRTPTKTSTNAFGLIDSISAEREAV